MQCKNALFNECCSIFMIKPFLFMKKKGTEKEIFALKSYETFKILVNYKK